MIYLRQIWSVAVKDLRSEWRTKEALNASLAFSLVILILFSFAFDPTSEMLREFSGGLLWMVFAFAGALILNRSFSRELQNDCLEVLIACPVPPSALFLGKSLANWCLLMILETICLAAFGIFYNVRWAGNALALAGVIALGTWSMTVIGTMFSALTVNLRLRELMLPTLVYPMLVPALMAAIQLTGILLAGQPIGENQIWIRVLVGFDLIFTSLAVMLVDTVLVG